MSQIDLKDSVIRLYEDASMTEDLTDLPAQALLQWGEKKLRAMAGKHSSPDSFETEFKSLRQLMKAISRFTGQRAQLATEEQRALMQKIAERAAELGYAIPGDQLEAFMAGQGELAEGDSVQALIALVEGPAPQTFANALTQGAGIGAAGAGLGDSGARGEAAADAPNKQAAPPQMTDTPDRETPSGGSLPV